MNISTETLIIILAILIAIVVGCVISQKDTWEGIGEKLRNILYLVISLIFIGGIALIVWTLVNQLTV